MLSRATKISLLLAVDLVFFFIELIVGYAVGSLALVADSFHMLNDVMSLIVALYAIKLAQSEASPQYSYGWHRAEIVAALINGVFLLALCFSIFMEAMERFFSTPEITNAKVIVIVGTLGLASNFLGLFLFHEHAHSHEEAKPKSPDRKSPSTTEPGPSVVEPLPEDARRRDSFTQLYGYPAATRATVVQAAQDIGYGRPTSPTTIRGHHTHGSISSINRERQSLLRRSSQDARYGTIDAEVFAIGPDANEAPQEGRAASAQDSFDSCSDEERGVGVSRKRASADHAHGHGHGSMNMRALVLHVIGDALGNVGVISTGLVIWLSTWKYKFYFDPVISLVITFIIFSSALPLVRSASFILLQAVPSTISLLDVREDIQNVDGVLSVHELHVWQLSEEKIVASVHVWVSRRREYMRIARDIRRVLHEHGVHSCTIQPEFHDPANDQPEEHLITDQETHCLITCPPDQACPPNTSCCPPQKPPSKPPSPPLVDA